MVIQELVMVLKEPELFAFLKEFYYPDLEMSTERYSKHDCISRQARLYIELKSRNTHYDDLIIEKIKYDSIIEQAGNLACYPQYINSTPEGIWAFDLSTMPVPEWEDKWLPAKTEFPSGGNKTKVIGYLHIKDGKKL